MDGDGESGFGMGIRIDGDGESGIRDMIEESGIGSEHRGRRNWKIDEKGAGWILENLGLWEKDRKDEMERSEKG